MASIGKCEKCFNTGIISAGLIKNAENEKHIRVVLCSAHAHTEECKKNVQSCFTTGYTVECVKPE